MAPTILSAEGVAFQYGGIGHTILQDISFSIAEGELISILGPSGSGKSTLLYLLGGFLHPLRGLLKFRGTAIEGPDTQRGIVFQDFALFDWRSARKNVEFGLECQGVERARRRQIASDALRLVGLESAADKYPQQLSGGMKQRVAIARSLACNPAVLLMDEPFGALDALTRDNLQDELKDIWRKTRKTVVFVTHSVEEAVYLSQRIMILDSQVGGVREIVDVGIPDGTRQEVLQSDRYRELCIYLNEVVRTPKSAGH